MITKLLWYYERKRSYPALTRHHEVRRSFTYGAEATIAVLAVPKCIDDAIWSLWSWLNALDGRVTPRLFVDGPVAERQRRMLSEHFPGIVIEELRPWLARRQDFGPQMRRLIAAYTMGAKTALIAALSNDGPAIYSDSDILAFNQPDQLMDGLSRGRPMYMLDRYGSNFAPDVVAAAGAQGMVLPDQLNSGLIALPRRCLDLEQFERFLERFTGWDGLKDCWFSEQALTALLLGAARAEALDRDHYVVSLDRQFVFETDADYAKIKVRHFTGPVRHVMYLKGIPYLMKKVRRP